MQDQLSQKFAALADPTRRAMLKRLSAGNANVTEIAEPFLGQMSLPAVTKHLKVLEKAGLIIKTQDAQRRLCELNPDGFQDAIQFMEHYRKLAEESLDRLGEYLKTLTAQSPQAVEEPKARTAKKSATPSAHQTSSRSAARSSKPPTERAPRPSKESTKRRTKHVRKK